MPEKMLLDLRSDTVTQPTPAMRLAMANAEVGDDVYGDDPTVNRLEALAAKTLGKEAALFVPSGTMGNQIAIRCHTSHGQEIIASAHCHIIGSEQGGAAQLSGCCSRTIEYPHDQPDAAMIAKALRDPNNVHNPETGLICLENALSTGGVVSVERMQAVWELAQAHSIPVHLDGARVFNAAVALGVDVKEITARCDSVMACVSKGLCAPVGSILAGNAEFIRKARRVRKVFGGGMRQAGILAAAGILSLTEMTDRLAEDHANAELLAGLLMEIPGLELIDFPGFGKPHINMVFVRFNYPDEAMQALYKHLLESGFRINPPRPEVGPAGMREGCALRFCTHYGITSEDVRAFAAAIRAGLPL